VGREWGALYRSVCVCVCDRERDIQRGRGGYTQREREKERDREGKKEREREGGTERKRDRERERKRQKEKERNKVLYHCHNGRQVCTPTGVASEQDLGRWYAAALTPPPLEACHTSCAPSARYPQPPPLEMRVSLNCPGDTKWQ